MIYKRIRRSHILFILILLFPFAVCAQDGPGGIGNRESLSNLKVWLRADSVNLNGPAVDTLFDLSGYENHFSQTNTSYQPSHNSNDGNINNMPSLDFDGAGEHLLDSNGYVNGLSAYTIIMVVHSDQTGVDNGFFTTNNPANSDTLLSLRYDQTGTNNGASNIITGGVGPGVGDVYESSTNIQSTNAQFISFLWNTGNKPELFIDGAADVPSYSSPITSTLSGADTVFVGKGTFDELDNEGWDGRIAEVIFFNRKLDTAERIILENYLSARYNHSITNDKYSSSTYIYDVAGIGIEPDGKHNSSASAGFGIREDNSTLDADGEYIFFGHDNSTNDIASIRKDAEITTNLGADGAAWNRDWYLEKTAGTSVDLKVYFDIGDGIEDGGIPQNISNYKLIYRSGTSGNYEVVTATNSGLQNGDQVYFEVDASEINDGYYTLGTVDQTNSPVEGSSSQTWYTLVSGDWNNSDIWTLDPSGALPDNPDNEIPDAKDNVVILSGKTVTAMSSGYELNSITVEGRLYLGTTSGHDFTDINGNGRIYVEGDHFPAGDSTDFVTPGLDEGTVVYSGTGNYSLEDSRAFYNMEVIMDNASDTVSLLADYTVNGNLKIEKGALRINDNDPAHSTPLVLNVSGNVDVYPDGAITVGEADAYVDNVGGNYGDYHKGFHQLIVGGDFLNQGNVTLTNLSTPDYSVGNMATDLNGAVSLVFKGASNNTFKCEATTDLYNLVVDKGGSQTYELEIYAEDTSHFALFGDNNNNWNNTGHAANPETQKALWIKSGTMRLTGEIYIPSLTEGSVDFPLGEKARLLLDGPNVFVSVTADGNDTYENLSHGDPLGVDDGYSSQGFYLLGRLQVNNGHFLLNKGEAINFLDQAPGSIVLNGGILETNQITVSSGATTGNYSYYMSGGVLKLIGNSWADDNSALLHLDNSDMVFTMSGGQIRVEGISSNSPNGIRIASSEGNYNVTGGSVNIDYTGGTPVQINSTANFYHMTVEQNTEVILQSGLEITKDLTIENGATLDADGNDLSIGRDFNFNDGATFTHGNNTTYFIGDDTTAINIENTGTASPLNFYNVGLNKDQKFNPDEYWPVRVLSPGRPTDPANATNTALTIENNLTIDRGEFDTHTFTVEVNENIDLGDGNIVGDSGESGIIELTGSATTHELTSNSEDNTMGHVVLNDGNDAQLQRDVKFADFTLSTGIMDIQEHRMTVDSGRIQGSGFGDSKMIMTDGTSGAKGLSFYLDIDNRTYTTETVANYPIGVSGSYSPGQITVNGNPGESEGYFTVIPVNTNHPAITFGGLDFYWRTRTTMPDVTDDVVYFQFTYDGTVPGGLFNPYYGIKLYNKNWLFHNDETGESILDFDENYEDIDGFIEADFTAASLWNAVFGTPRTLYSTGNGDWNTPGTWDQNVVPRPQDIAIVRENDTVTVGAGYNAEVGDLTVNGALIINNNDPNNHVLERVSGPGTIIMTSENVPVNSVFDDFLNNDTATFEYRHIGTDYTIPNNFTEYPTLKITGVGTITSPGQDITVRRNLIINDQNNTGTVLALNGGADGDITVEDSLILTNQGSLLFPAVGGQRIVTVQDELLCNFYGYADNNSIEVETGGVNTDPAHQLILYGDMDMAGSDMTFWTGAGNRAVDLYFRGTEDAQVIDDADGTSNITLNRLIVDKYTGKFLNFYEEFTLNGVTNAFPKALELASGNLNLDNSNIDIDLSTGGADFTIPSESILELNQSTVNISGNNTGLKLDGKLVIGDQASALLNGGTNNYIEYSSSGNSEISIDQGTLRVGAQIRRPLFTEEGVLKFYQNHENSNVIVGENDAQTGSRGVFEILNAGSVFEQADGANITIVRQQQSPSVAALYLEPGTSNLGLGSSITFGNTNTPADQTMGINSNVPLKNIIVNSNNAPTVQMQIRNLTIEEDLNIESSSTFDANGLNLNIEGDFTNSGTFSSNGNTTTFNGTDDQTITGNTSFYNLIKPTNNKLGIEETTTDSIYVDNNFRIKGGTFADSSNAIMVRGNLFIDGTHVYGGTGNGIEMDGSVEQEISGNGTLGKFTISNPYGAVVLEGNEITISEALNLNGGILDVGANLLNLGVNAEIIAGEPFGSTNMIQTNTSFTDNGVRKILPSTADAGGAYNYKIPIGSGNKYTPVTYNINSNDNSTGAIITKAANEMHPSITDDTEDPEIFDPDYVLKYHWVLKSEGISGFEAEVDMQYEEGDVSIKSPYYITDYITARLLNDGSGQWNKFSTDDFDEANQQLNFTFEGVGDAQIEGDYTAGIDDAIPDQVPFYETKNNGPWTEASTWTPEIEGGPRGAMVRINGPHTVYMPSNFQTSYTTTINGRLEVDSTFGHRLGEVDGTGTLYTKRASLPAGYYEEFFSSAGGTLEYGGSGSYDVLSKFSQVNNLIFSGTGERRFPNQESTILGDLTIDGDDATLEAINDHDEKINIAGNIDFLTGSFDAGSGPDAIVEMNGSAEQIITGDFTGSDNFYHFEIDNSNDLTLNGSIDIEADLTFTNGIITSSAANILSLTNINSSVNGYGSSNYVNGPIRKKLESGRTFTFPVGDGDRYGKLEIISTTSSGSQYWEAEYYDDNPDNNTSLNTTDFENALERVSGNEYWRVNGPASGTAANQIRWDEFSLLPAETDDRENNMKMVEWNTTSGQWEIVDPATVVDNGINNGTITSDNNLGMDGDHYYTLGTTESDPLPTAGFITLDTAICEGSTATLRVEVTGEPNFEIVVDDGSATTTYSGSSSPITFDVNPGSTTTYTITEVTEDTDGSDGGPTSSTNTIFGDPVTVTVNPLPQNFPLSGGGSICSNDSTELQLDGSQSGVDYEVYRDDGTIQLVNVVSGTGSAISLGYYQTGGDYTVTAVDVSTGCSRDISGTETILVTQAPDPEPTAVYGSVCYADSATVDTLDANDIYGVGTSYTWSPDSVLTFINTDPADQDTAYYQPTWNPKSVSVERWFKVTVSGNGCTAVDSVNVELLRKPETGNQYYVPSDFDQ